MDLLKLVENIKSRKDGKTDFGILKVAFMVAALDGDITGNEYDIFEKMAQKCRGCTAETASKALAAAMRSAGYLMLLAQRVPTEQLIEAFIAEAEDALPNGFASMSIKEVRRAIVAWIAMAMSDGDYSAREKACIEALRRHFAELKVMRQMQEAHCAAAAGSVFGQAFDLGGAMSVGGGVLVSQDFVGRVENVMQRLGSSEDADKELERLIEG